MRALGLGKWERGRGGACRHKDDLEEVLAFKKLALWP